MKYTMFDITMIQKFMYVFSSQEILYRISIGTIDDKMFTVDISEEYGDVNVEVNEVEFFFRGDSEWDAIDISVAEISLCVEYINNK